MVKVFGYYGHNNAGDEAFKLVFDRVFAGHRVEYAAPGGGPLEADRPLVVGGGAVLNDYFLEPIRHIGAVHVVGCSLPYGEADAARVAASLGGRIRTLLVRSRADVAALRRAGLPAEFVPDLVFSLDRGAPPGPVPQSELEGWTALPPRRWGRHERTAVVCLSDDYHVPWSAAQANAFTRLEVFKNELARALDHQRLVALAHPPRHVVRKEVVAG